jgi:hypothetical protein
LLSGTEENLKKTLSQTVELLDGIWTLCFSNRQQEC